MRSSEAHVPQLPFGLQPKEQRLEELINRTDTISADFDLYGVVDGEIRDLLTKVGKEGYELKRGR